MDTVLCDKEKLGQFLVFPAQVDLDKLTEELCQIEGDKLDDFVAVLQKEIDLPAVLSTVSGLLCWALS